MTRHAPLPRLANLIALRSPDESRRQSFAQRLSIIPKCRIFTPAPQWVVGVLDLPWSDHADGRDEQAGCFLVEGQHLLPSADNARQLERHHLHEAPQRPAKFSEAPEDISFLSIRPDGDATLLRSLGGRIPSYWWASNSDIYVTTNSTLLITLAGHTGHPDPLVSALCLTGGESCRVNRRTHLTDVQALGKAECLHITPQGNCDATPYWLPMAADALRWPSPHQRKDRQQRFREELIRNLTEGLTATGSNLLTLSGGVDSSLLLALSVGQLKKPVTSTSIIPSTDDAAYEREMARLHQLRMAYPTTAHLDITSSDHNQYALWRQLEPAAIPHFNPTLVGLTQLDSSQQPCVSFGGEQADEVCGSRMLTVPDWLKHTSKWRILTLKHQDIPQALKRSELLWRHADVASRFMRDHPPFTPELLPWLHRNLHAEWRSLRTTLTNDIQTLARQVANPFLWFSHRETDWQAMQWEWSSAQGVHRINPFSTSRIMALSLSSHPAERLGRGDKRLSREAFRGVFPASLLGRQDKGAFDQIHLPSNTMSMETLSDCLGDPAWLSLRDPSCDRQKSANRLPNPASLALADDYFRYLFFADTRKKIRQLTVVMPTSSLDKAPD